MYICILFWKLKLYDYVHFYSAHGYILFHIKLYKISMVKLKESLASVSCPHVTWLKHMPE